MALGRTRYRVRCAFGQIIDLLATPTGFEPVTLSLEGLRLSLLSLSN